MDTLYAHLARAVTMTATHPVTRATLRAETVAAGTLVEVRETSRGLIARLPGTSLSQVVYPASLVPA